MTASTIVVAIKDEKQLKAVRSALKQAGIPAGQIKLSPSRDSYEKEERVFLRLAEESLSEDWKEDNAWEKLL